MSIAEGRPGVEVRHQWNAGVILNDRHPAGAARVTIDRIGGWHSLAETDDQRYELGSRRGEMPTPTYPRGKTVVYEGRIEAKDLSSWRQTYRAMRGAFRERSAEGSMSLLGAEDTWFYRARVMQLDADDTPEDSSPHRIWRFRGSYELGLRLSDARFYYAPLVQHHSGDGANVTNLGTTDTDPVFVLSVSSAGDIALHNAAIDRDLVFRDVPTGNHVLTFGPGRRAFTTATGADLSGLLDVGASDWWDELVPGFVPGVNAITTSGIASWRADYYHADE